MHARKPNVLIVYRNFMANNPMYCHVGLGVNALHTVEVLRERGVIADLAGVWIPEDITKVLLARPHVTHCIIEAPWVSTPKLIEILTNFPKVHFVVRTHSQIGFLQVEAGAIKLIREQLDLQDKFENLRVAANSDRLVYFIKMVYHDKCLYLPNLYNIGKVHPKKHHHHTDEPLRISSFGALRLLKNHTTAAAAALSIAASQNRKLEFWISVNREEHGKGIINSLSNMFTGLSWAKLVENPWQDWRSFRKTIGKMDLTLQVSFTESFNIVSADSIAEGVPSVVTSAIDWAPKNWHADGDSVEDITRVGLKVLENPHIEAEKGLHALKSFVHNGGTIWLEYLNKH